MLGFSEENTLGGYSPLKMTAPLIDLMIISNIVHHRQHVKNSVHYFILPLYYLYHLMKLNFLTK